jgi:hypothetical protein
MVLNKPFEISSRLLPAVKIGDCTISFEAGKDWFYFDFSDGKEFVEKNWNAGGMRRTGVEHIREAFSSILDFMSACGESYRYKMSHPDSEPDCLTLFPEEMREYCYQNSDELSMLSLDLQENGSELIQE